MRYAGRVGKPVDPRMAQASAINHQKLQSLYPVFEWFEINPGYLQKPIGNCFFSAYHGHAAVWPVNHADGLKLICGERHADGAWAAAVKAVWTMLAVCQSRTRVTSPSRQPSMLVGMGGEVQYTASHHGE
ncbi:predicted protein [Plenodomus lingam JN3]|uniref:Uncharacterized protein n=1 Tax=Leptosphaeria maculans (strain JN3 / isolate v23.1.3 / race Av1-4-5-6-7-8) TaxID=985895 RepID=E4ZFZ5_LEPMJ|nr:predicted protein [Plenodomus lingam JN3]CBX90215.1 predicted protein [Plenodomus lingam JN3]